MTVYHKNLRQRWQKMSLHQQMANFGSEASRATARQKAITS